MKVFTWSSLRAIGNSPISKLSILMPLIGYILLFQENIVRAGVMPFLFPDLIGGHGLLNLYILYFGLFLYGIASLIFHVFCSEVIKKFGSREEYLQAALVVGNLQDVKSILTKVGNSDGEDIRSNAKYYLSSIETGVIRQVDSSIILFSYGLKFDHENRKFVFARKICFYLYLLGMILVSIPSIVTFCVIFGRVLSMVFA